MGDETQTQEIRIRLSSALKEDLDNLAKTRGISTASLVRHILRDCVREKYYTKVLNILNIEDRVGNAIITELYPELEEIKSRLDMIADIVQMAGLQNAPREEKGDGKQEQVVHDEKRGEGDFPKIPGLHYKVDGNNVIYEDGSIYNLCLGAWLVTKEEVAKWKRKREKERNLLR